MTELVVCLRGTGSADDLRRTTEALSQHTDDLAFVVFDPGEGADSVARKIASERTGVCVVSSPAPGGAGDDVLAWSAVRAAAAADVVLLEVGALVGPNWRAQLRNAAYRDPVIATASAMPTEADGGNAAVHPAPAGVVEDAASLGAPVRGCVYVRRDALDIAVSAGWNDGDEFRTAPVALEEVMLVPGLVHVLAPAIVTLPAKAPTGRPRLPDTPATRRVAAEIEAAVGPLRVTIDLRCCAYPLSGTQVHALNLVSALARRDDVGLSVLVPTYPHKSARPHLAALPASLTRHAEGGPIRPRPQIFHRPYQVFEWHMNDVVASGARFVVTHQDLILDRTPAYFGSEDRWRNYVAATALSLVAADEVVFFSEHARREAVADGLVEDSKTSVVPPGTDHLDGRSADEVAPAALVRAFGAESRPFILFVGNAYFHKNRLFALRVTQELVARHGWDGAIVSAGGRPPHGSSASHERRFLRDHDEFRSRFAELSHVTDGELRWLYRHAALVLFPTLYEGFGLVPFEAAVTGTPCLYSSRSSVAEYLPPEGALVELGDVGATAERVWDVLANAELRNRIVDAIRTRGEPLTWRTAADSYVQIYRRALARPIGVPLVFGDDVRIGTPGQMATTEVERQMLRVFKRSAALRTLAETVLGWSIEVRRAVRRM